MATKIPSSIKLTYFGIEGRAECVRLTFLLAGIDFEDERIAPSDWGKIKPTTPHGVVPVLSIDGGPLRGESGAMIRWAASLKPEKELYPADKIYDVEEAIGLIGDMQNSWGPCLYIGMRPQKFGFPEDYAKTDEGKARVKELREKWVKNELPVYMNYIEKSLGDGQWIAGTDKPSIADCFAVPFLRGFSRGFMDHVPADCLDDYPKVKDYIKRFCDLPEVSGRYTDGIH